MRTTVPTCPMIRGCSKLGIRIMAAPTGWEARASSLLRDPLVAEGPTVPSRASILGPLVRTHPHPTRAAAQGLSEINNAVPWPIPRGMPRSCTLDCHGSER